MDIIRTFVPNSFANYNHLVVCQATKEAAAVDPFSAEHLSELAQENGVTITQIWITHEHNDHIKDLSQLKQKTDAIVFAPISCQSRFDADVWLEDSSVITLGNEQAEFFLTPGHTPGHGVYFCNSPTSASQTNNIQTNNIQTNNIQTKNIQTSSKHHGTPVPFLICGDTLFNAGVGNIKSGNVEQLFTTIERFHAWLPDACEIYSGHDYLTTNLKFTLHYCPDHSYASTLLEEAEKQTPDTRAIQNWAQEKTYNLFLQLNSPTVTALTGIPDGPSATLDRFKTLRNLRDKW